MASRLLSQSICIVALSLFILADATPSSSSSQPSAFVRGMGDSDSQLLYMAVSETARGGGERGEENERSVTVESSSSSNPQTEQMHRVIDKGVSFADIVRKRAFLPRDNGSLF